MKLPPYDKYGHVEPHDHEEISNDDSVIRRVTEHHINRRTGAPKLSSMLFEPSSSGSKSMSVDIEKLILDEGADPATHVMQGPSVGAVKIEAGTLRAQELQVGYEPLPENLCHGGVWGSFPRGKKKRLIEQSVFLVRPPGF